MKGDLTGMASSAPERGRMRPREGLLSFVSGSYKVPLMYGTEGGIRVAAVAAAPRRRQTCGYFIYTREKRTAVLSRCRSPLLLSSFSMLYGLASRGIHQGQFRHPMLASGGWIRAEQGRAVGLETREAAVIAQLGRQCRA